MGSYELWFTDEDVAGLAEVNAAVKKAAKEFQAKWVAAMGSHSRSGRFARSIKVSRANGKDYWVEATVNYAAWAEFGHEGFVFSGKTQTLVYIGPVPGIHVLGSLL